MTFFKTGAWRYLKYEPSNVAVKQLGSVAVVTGRVDRIIKISDKETVGSFAFTHVWNRVKNGWQLTSSHVTTIPSPAAAKP
jgi:urease accessory protein UreF